MNDNLANRLLAKIMNWNNDDINTETPNLQALAIFGYDHYQQYKPGRRFIESLAVWLNNFDINSRKPAFEFIKNKLLFVTRSQMEHIISITYLDYIVPILLEQVAKNFHEKIPRWNITKLYETDEFNILHNRCLFVGLSDGSKVDIFRRSNKKINHEQVYLTHEMNESRVKIIIKELKKRLKNNNDNSLYFQNVFLLDDFSGSGISYINKKNGKIFGKIANFCYSIRNKHDPIYNLFDLKNIHIYLILYVATEQAEKHLQELGNELFVDIPFSVIIIQKIPNQIKYKEDDDHEFTKLIKNEMYEWNNLSNVHMSQGTNKKPYLGFDKCALPVVLYHNTPNNSLPILHYNDDVNFTCLFPRVSRHK